MSISTEKFVHKQIPVDAVRVTAENMRDISEWVFGQIKETDDRFSNSYIDMVSVDHHLNPGRVMVFIGDWIVTKKTSMLVYTDEEFRNNFEPAGVDKTEEVARLMVMALSEMLSDPQAADHVSRRMARTIVDLFR